jgi:hypothetical protein
MRLEPPRSCTPASEDGVKKSPKHVRQKWIDKWIKNLSITFVIIQHLPDTWNIYILNKLETYVYISTLQQGIGNIMLRPLTSSNTGAWRTNFEEVILNSQSVKWLGICCNIRVWFTSGAVTLIFYRSRLVWSRQNWDHSNIKYVFMFQMSRTFEFMPKRYSLPWRACTCLHRLYLKKGQLDRKLVGNIPSHWNWRRYVGWGGRMIVSTAYRVRPIFNVTIYVLSGFK